MTVNSAEVFDRFGLRASGFWRSLAIPPRSDGTRPGSKLRDAFEQLGGIYLAFAQFLLWRADLLGVDYLTALQQMRVDIPPVPREQVAALLEAELGKKGERLADGLEAEAAWSTLSRTAYRTKYQGETIVVQVGRVPFSDGEFAEFEAGISFLGHPDIERVTSPRVLREFRQWLRHTDSVARERSYLEVLSRADVNTFTQYPALIPEITTDRVLCWPWVPGDSVRTLIEHGSVGTVMQVATAVLEQLYSLSIVEAELDLDAMVISSDLRLVMRRINRPFSIPPPQVNVGMKYVAAVLEGDAAITVQTLVTLALGKSSGRLEADLLERLSGIEPELKVHLWYPGSAAAFESNWRALASMNLARPIYLNCLHRNLIAIGYWNADAVFAGGKATDCIPEAQFPVVDRLVRLQLSQFLDPSVVREWASGAGLLMFGAMRQANRLAEEVRENNLTIGSELESTDGDSHQANRDVRLGIFAGILLVILLFSLRWGATLPKPAATLVLGIAPFALIGLFWAIAKIG
jgi:hypothetical protein